MTKKPETTIKSYSELFTREEDDLVYDDENTQNPFTGVIEDFHAKFQLYSRGNYKDGKKDGLWEGFWDNGQLEWRGYLKDGKEDGMWEGFDENGQIEFTSYYINGKKVKRKKYLKSK